MGKTSKIRLAFLGILVIAVFAALVDFPEFFKQSGFFNRPFRLGLDLAGGTHLIYQADITNIPAQDRSSSLEGVRDVIERRVNSFGIAEPVVQTAKSGDTWRIIVDLAGITDITEAIKMIGETPLLEFKTEPVGGNENITRDEQDKIDSLNTEEKNRAQTVLNLALAPDADFAALAKEYSDDLGSKYKSGEIGLQSRDALVPEFEKTCFDELAINQTSDHLTETNYGYHIIKKIGEQGSGENYQTNCAHILIKKTTLADIRLPADVWTYTGLTGKQLKKARIETDPQTNAVLITLEFNEEGQALMAEITAKNVGKPLGIFLDGYSIIDTTSDGKITKDDAYAPIINEEIRDGRAVITGAMNLEQAGKIAQRLNSGALPVPINLISQQTVGATLGKLSVEKSLQAGIIGLILVAIFMVIVYRLPGLLADLALIFYGLILLALFKLIPVTLTLAGISGFILSIGMAVDANVLIFERLKEEVKSGKGVSEAINISFQRAWPSIRDGNYTTILTCIILMWFSTSIVKGFAITLLIGVIISMFSSLFVTKILFLNIKSSFFEKYPWLLSIKKHEHN